MLPISMGASNESRRARRAARRVMLLGALLGAVVALSTGTLLYQQHQRALEDAKRELLNVAVVLGDHIDRSFQSVDLVQSSLLDRIHNLGIRSPEEYEQRVSGRETHDLLKEKISSLPQIDAVTLIKADGKLLNFSRYFPIPKVNVADRDYFKALSTNPGLTSFVSEPVPNRGTGTWTVYNAKKVSGADGEFIGLVLGAVELAHFEQVFQGVSLGEAGSIAMFRRDGILLARFPHVDPSIGKSFAGQKIFEDVLRFTDRGVVRQTSLVDGKERIIAVRALPHYPIAVTATKTVEGALSQWAGDAKYLALLAALAELLIVFGVIKAIRQVRVQEKLTAAEAGRAAAEERERATQELAVQYEIVREKEEELRTQNTRFETALSNMCQGLVMFDKNQRIIVCNSRYQAIYGLSPEMVKPGNTLRALFDNFVALGQMTEEQAARSFEDRQRLIQTGTPATGMRLLSDGRTIQIMHEPTKEGGWVGTHEDITERRKAEARITHMAHHDALTGLSNRVLFREEMQRALNLERSDSQIAVLCLDLDLFKAVNDTLGHPIGDALLRAVSARLTDCVRETDTVARLGGDEFAIVQIGATQPQHAAALAKQIIEELHAPFDIEGHIVEIGTSVGIAVAPDGCSDPDHLLKSADMALYQAKADGRGVYRFFEPEMDAKIQERRALELDLRKALPNGEFEVHYQPLVNLAANKVSGFEALLRWTHPERGRISPVDFIPLAEEIGLIGQIGAWVLKQACTDAANWPSNVRVAVNISSDQFNRRALFLDVMSALGFSGLPANRLELEITESVLLQNTESTLGTLRELRDQGVRVSMDDFGTGYSSLSYLRKFPFDKIKIDQSFVRDVADGNDAQAIIKAVIALGNSLGMSTTAEGVETAEQLEELRREGCTEVQGWLFSPALPASEVLGLIDRIAEEYLRVA